MKAKLFVLCGVLLALGEAARSPTYNMAPSRGSFGSGRNSGANRGNLGADCEYDDDCFMDNAFCHMQMQCKCKRNYEPNTSRDSCVARIGADCRSRFDCSSLENSECRQNMCGCQDGFIPFQERVCLRLPARIGDACVADDQCRVLGENARCQDSRCQCSPNEHMADGKCYPNIPLRQSCNHKNDCYIGEGFQGMLQCRNGVCQCSSGYHETPDRKCAGGDGASSLQISLFVFIASVFSSVRSIF